MNYFNILFTSAGRRVSLIQHFKKTLEVMELPGRIITADLQKTAPAPFAADIRKQVPPVTNAGYIDALLDICTEHQIKLVIPLIDTELYLLAMNHGRFKNIGTTLLVSDAETNKICMDKENTYRFFKDAGIETPELYDFEKIIANDVKYPMLIKPADGSSGKGVIKINNMNELDFFKTYIPNPIVQEYVEGEEYTLDVLVDFTGKVRCIVPRLRMETRAGEVSKSITVKNTALIAAGKKVVDALPGAMGCLTLQCFLTPEGNIKFIEINPRFGGGFPLSMKAGADFPRWIIEMMLGKYPQIDLDGWKEEIVMLRYDDAFFVTKKDIL